MGRIGRSFQLVGQSYRVLMQDKELMILPLISGTVIVAIAVSFFFGFSIDPQRFESHSRDWQTWLPVFLFYVATYAVGIFFQAAVIAGATERMRGGDLTLGSALSAAFSRIGSILLWAVVAATVGTLLRMLRDRAGFVGRIIVSIVGAAWSLATFFVVPVLVLEGVGVQEGIPRSLELFKKTWGETFVGGVNLGVAALVGWVTLIALVGLAAWAGLGILALVIGIVGAISLMIFFSALQGVFVASLYQYASGGDAAPGFDRDALAQAFVPKRR